MKNTIYYHDYLQLDKIIKSQRLISKEDFNNPAHDEMLFIVSHQSFELWFVEILHELSSVIMLLEKPFDDSSDAFPTAIHQLERIKEIWKLLLHQYDVLETMTSLDFLDFRKYLHPSSGFQSYQFKAIEGMLGLTEEIRFSPINYSDKKKGAYYKRVDKKGGALSAKHSKYITEIENSNSLFSVLVDWLKRMPFFDKKFWGNMSAETYWEEYAKAFYEGLSETDKNKGLQNDLKNILESGIEIRKEIDIPINQNELSQFKEICLTDSEYLKKVKSVVFNRFDGNCVQTSLFILVNRYLPIFYLPFKFISVLMDIDELVSMWRYKHLLIVRKIIGQRTGTGNTSGADYLKSIVDYNVIFPELKVLSTFLLERKKVPALPPNLKSATSFSNY